ncbi:unnamed protein product [Brugia timori]|uniref:Uncharacterized protein n=1 Tax=Brugia timori TaxID=42155 RepID=A0A0R3QAP8_9BILA|nr:unnamed protein product [Brugia timori]
MVDCFYSNRLFILNTCLTQYHTAYLRCQNSIQEQQIHDHSILRLLQTIVT